MNAGTYLAPYVRSFFEDHLVCRRNVAGNTIQSYRDAIKLFLAYVAASLKKPAMQLLVTDVTESVVLGFLADLERSRGNSIQTRNHRLTSLRRLYEYISRQEPLLLDHCRRIATIPLKRGAALPQMQYLTKEEIGAVFGAVDRQAPRGQRDYALLLFMYNTGSRVQEAADTRASWLSLQAPCKAEILGKGRKWRTCPLWSSTAQALKQLLQSRVPLEQDDHVFLNRFGRPISRSGIEDILRKYTTLAGRTMTGLKNKRVTPHTIRHTTAMHLLQSGVDVNVIRSWLGHASIATTNHYVEIDLEMKAQALKTCEVTGDPSIGKRWRSSPEILTWLDSL
ncbi:MAG TPA: tyrosine-type recombinase/integrase [Phycisphaerae bacterium]|nr:tyrosine-type recombinase/integrase [Phycisphaerae bacterium]